MTRWLPLLVVLTFACATAPQASSKPPAAKEVSAASLVDHAGDSVETAIAVPRDAPNEGIDWINNWIYDRYGRFRRTGWGLAHQQNRHYKVVKFELPDHSQHTAYFDITEIWESWKPETPQP